jgi:hypothetical protein
MAKKELYPSKGTPSLEYIEQQPCQDYPSTIKFSSDLTEAKLESCIKDRRPGGSYRKSFGAAANSSPDQKFKMPIHGEDGKCCDLG